MRETDFPELQALPRPGFGDREWVLRGNLPSGELPQPSRNPSTPPPPPAESAMSLHPQIIEKDGRKDFVVLPDEGFAASRPPSFLLFISAFSSARILGAGGSVFSPPRRI